MSNFKLGAIITDVSGSIGGTTLRRIRGGFSMYNKSRGASRARLLANDALPTLTELNQLYSQLTEIDRLSWRDLARTLTFPNKFGDQVNLTARALFQKCNGRLSHLGVQLLNCSGRSVQVPVIQIVNVDITKNGNKFKLQLPLPPLPGYFLVQVLPLSFTDEIVTFGRSKVIAADYLEIADVFDFTDQFWNRFPNAQIGDYFTIGVTMLSEVGLSQLMPQFIAIVNQGE